MIRVAFALFGDDEPSDRNDGRRLLKGYSSGKSFGGKDEKIDAEALV